MRKVLCKTLLCVSLGISAVVGTEGYAQAVRDYPKQPINLLVGYPAGGSVDIVARAYAQRMTEVLGQSVVVDNRSGASGAIAAQAVARARPDGHTLYFVASPTVTITPAIQNTVFDPNKDFQTIGLVANFSNVLLVGGDSSYATLQDLIADAKAQPGKLTFGSSGLGSSNHIAAELLAEHTSLDLIHVPYKGSVPAMTDLVGGRISLLFDMTTTASAFANSGRVKALAVTSGERNHLFPDVPTMKESGYPDLEYEGWLGVIGPVGLPDHVVETLVEATEEVLQSPDFKDQMIAAGYVTMHATPEQLRERIQREGDFFQALAKRANLRQP